MTDLSAMCCFCDDEMSYRTLPLYHRGLRKSVRRALTYMQCTTQYVFIKYNCSNNNGLIKFQVSYLGVTYLDLRTTPPSEEENEPEKRLLVLAKLVVQVHVLLMYAIGTGNNKIDRLG